MIRLILTLVALRSPERWKVGALYVEGLKWSTGYNTSADYGHHAEDLAVENFMKKYGKKPKGGTMYCTFSPCTNCVKTLKSHNMTSKYLKKYRGKL